MAGIVAKAAERHRAADRFGLGRNDRLDLALLQAAVDLGVGVAGIGRDGLN